MTPADYAGFVVIGFAGLLLVLMGYSVVRSQINRYCEWRAKIKKARKE